MIQTTHPYKSLSDVFIYLVWFKDTIFSHQSVWASYLKNLFKWTLLSANQTSFFVIFKQSIISRGKPEGPEKVIWAESKTKRKKNRVVRSCIQWFKAFKKHVISRNSFNSFTSIQVCHTSLYQRLVTAGGLFFPKVLAGITRYNKRPFM